MLIAGIGTLIQLYPIWQHRLEVCRLSWALSFTFLAACMVYAASQDYGIMVGGQSSSAACIEGVLGLTVEILAALRGSPMLSSACVVTDHRLLRMLTVGVDVLSARPIAV